VNEIAEKYNKEIMEIESIDDIMTDSEKRFNK